MSEISEEYAKKYNDELRQQKIAKINIVRKRLKDLSVSMAVLAFWMEKSSAKLQFYLNYDKDGMTDAVFDKFMTALDELEAIPYEERRLIGSHKHCQFCGKPLPLARDKFCDETCAFKQRAKNGQHCTMCGTLFFPTNGRQTQCESCRKAEADKNRRIRIAKEQQAKDRLLGKDIDITNRWAEKWGLSYGCAQFSLARMRKLKLNPNSDADCKKFFHKEETKNG